MVFAPPPNPDFILPIDCTTLWWTMVEWITAMLMPATSSSNICFTPANFIKNPFNLNWKRLQVMVNHLINLWPNIFQMFTFKFKLYVMGSIAAYLKAVDTIGNCQNPVFSFGVSQHVHKITNLWKFELDWSSKLRDNYERKKHPCHTKLCAFRYEVLKSTSWKITSSSKTTSLQREPFLTRFYTINFSLLLLTNYGFMLIIILSNYQ